ncbi:hypothetical protein [Bradyrhizobium sp. McL0616]|uniref:hypothetical protein n=1 Tax=Bradyrhizobium sp. McL0616 TaxID=3415674 RepID=UPI003CF67C63
MKFKLFCFFAIVGLGLICLTYIAASDPEVLALVGSIDVLFIVASGFAALWCIST